MFIALGFLVGTLLLLGWYYYEERKLNKALKELQEVLKKSGLI